MTNQGLKNLPHQHNACRVYPPEAHPAQSRPSILICDRQPASFLVEFPWCVCFTSSNHHQPNPNNISNKSSFAQQDSSLWPEPLPSTPIHIETRPFEIYHSNQRNVYGTICNRLLLLVAIAEMRPGAFPIGMIPTCTDRKECARIIGRCYQSTEYKR